jgi:hypothetical protein
MIALDGSVVVLIIRRLRCRDCNKTHHELPDLLVPYKRHGAETIEGIIGCKTENTCCEESTIRKIKAWWGAMLLYFQSILAWLEEKYKVKFQQPSVPREIVRAVANAHLWVHTRSAFLSG